MISNMFIYGLQLDIAWEDKAANYEKVRRLVERARPERGSLLVLPEMFATGFSMNVATIGEPEHGPTAAFLQDLARQHGLYVVGGFTVKQPGGRGLNQAIAIDPDGNEVARYSKVHPFSMGKEGQHYDGGRDPVLFDWAGIKVCPVICYDLRFPELFRAATRRGAEMFLVIANFPAAREAHWTTLLAARAIENQAYVLGVNRAGKDPWLAYPGRSMLVDPTGNAVADAGRDEGAVSAPVDRHAIDAWRSDFPVLTDMKDHLFPEPEPGAPRSPAE
jgi:predicted amidohydrolase